MNRLGANFAVFLLFFGMALIEAVQKNNPLEAGLFLALGILSLWADFQKKQENFGMKKFWMIFVVLAISGTAAIAVVYNDKKTQGIATPTEVGSSLSYFMDAVTEKVKMTVADYEKLGLAGEADGFNLLKTYPGLLPSDFINVQAYQGSYSEEGGKLIFTGNGASNSAVLKREGMRTLLENVSTRLGVPSDTKSDIDRILSRLEEVSSYRTTLTGTYTDCIPRQDNFSPEGCRVGMKTAAGEYYILDFNLLSQPRPELKQGDKFTATGLVTPIEMISSEWALYSIAKGIFSVTDSVKIIK